MTVEAIEDRVRNEDEITRIVNVRILAGIPHLSTPEEEKKQRRRKILEWSCAGMMLAVMVAANTFTCPQEIAQCTKSFTASTRTRSA